MGSCERSNAQKEGKDRVRKHLDLYCLGCRLLSGYTRFYTTLSRAMAGNVAYAATRFSSSRAAVDTSGAVANFCGENCLATYAAFN